MRMATYSRRLKFPAFITSIPADNEQIKLRTIQLLQRFFRDAYCRNFSLSLWDGTLVPAREQESFVFHLRTPFALRAAMMPPLSLDPAERSLNPGRAYIERYFDVTGDYDKAFTTTMEAFLSCSKRDFLMIFMTLLRLPRVSHSSADLLQNLQGRKHSPERDAAAIKSHYDQPVELFRTFLDPELVYSCAYFREDDQTLAQAQLSKLDHVLNKLRVAPGDRLLDVGSGWGGLIIRAAERFGVTAHGITISHAQYEETRRRIAERNLGDRVTVEIRDYRTVPANAYDKIASIGMIEHIGHEQLGEFFNVMYRALRPGGLFLNQGVTDQSSKRKGRRAGGFLGRYVFPDGEFLPISMILSAAEHAGFEVRDVESLREHYVRTLHAWVAALDAAAAQATAATSDRTVRIWKLYLACSAQNLAYGWLGICQSLLERPRSDGKSDLPPTRKHLYEGSRPAIMSANHQAQTRSDH
jgi:cyclopropane-fatty-acyl-phospholipid synthase